MIRTTFDLFQAVAQCQAQREELCDGAVVLRGFALKSEAAVFAALRDVVAAAPFRHMTTPGSFRMSVAMTNCGSYGWVTDRTGYRYDAADPESGRPWPRMPRTFFALTRDAAASAGFEDFQPDACLVNRYETGARLSLHQDKNEHDFSAPIVSVSLGMHGGKSVTIYEAEVKKPDGKEIEIKVAEDGKLIKVKHEKHEKHEKHD